MIILLVFLLRQKVQSDQSVRMVFLVVHHNCNGVLSTATVQNDVFQFELVLIEFDFNGLVLGDDCIGSLSEGQHLNGHFIPSGDGVDIIGDDSLGTQGVLPALSTLLTCSSSADAMKQILLFSLSIEFEVHKVLGDLRVAVFDHDGFPPED